MTHSNEVIQPDGWAPAKGYANGVKATGTMIFVGGQIGWTADQVFETDDFVGQCEQALKNVRAVLEAGGAGPEHLVRLTWFVTDKRAYLQTLKELGRVYRDVMGRNFPAMTMVEVKALVEDRARVEIEATAVL
ncbi:RidA family protein [Pararhizobium haloflavum]|uniref:RidA family protein n=1 Tax=Pararhizobium haloflavum TaxID=2037914 RepID=UPI000C17B0C0|nr:RidA family protein [Pararhizobium haloflavum]